MVWDYGTRARHEGLEEWKMTLDTTINISKTITVHGYLITENFWTKLNYKQDPYVHP